MESHRKSEHHQAELKRNNRFQDKQSFLQSYKLNFKEKLVSSFLSANIPLHKFNHLALKSLCATMEKVLSFEIAALASVFQLASQKENHIRELLHYFLIVDEAVVARATQKYISMC